ncbi:MAG: Enolase [Methanosaeta sp. PtaB.Bin039]|nr:MAG: Enolase [Methanosaeta sp. PtaB.Bin039]HOT07687.1 phosphopyruvate hydratase [Methanotrichaceae archaeon]HQF17512.1 phosphopyruvate hydratase [Methanotrichaceae archaeon]HQI92083.1 phosphopyruvate hydratase [Methanotrichaceae archaeon]HQJ29322.1 phosphopyruvate hydratase [Methanotrichaceae archaeon]
MSLQIEKILAREILDSRGNPTVEVDVYTCCGFGRAAVPSGASTGTHEALEMRDGGDRYGGKGVQNAIKNVNEVIAPEVLGKNAIDQREIDLLMLEMDGTPNKSNLGANAILGVSLGVAKAAASSLGMPLYRYLGGVSATRLPVPALNVLNGGQHAGNDLAIQEFMILPRGAKNFTEGLRMAAETYHALGKILKGKYGSVATNVGYEGGYAPPLQKTQDALDAIMSALDITGYSEEIRIGLDAAASSFYLDGGYSVDGNRLQPGELIDFYEHLVNTYPIISIEDPFEEEAFEDFAALTRRLPGTIIVGDDLYVTNVKRLEKGIRMCSTNALLLKLNQIGSVSEAFDAATLAFRSSYKVMVSHRSAETEDSALADVAVSLGAEMLKTGAPARSERNAKYNQLMRIEEELGAGASYQKI